MRRRMTGIVLLCLIISTNCMAMSPQTTVDEGLKLFKNLAYDQGPVEERMAVKNPYIKELMDKVLGTMNYEIISCSNNGDTALVTVKITNLNMELIMLTAQDKVIENVLKHPWNSLVDYVSGGEEKFAMNLFMTIIEEAPKEYITNTVDIKVNKVNDKWVMEESEELMSAMTGGLDTAIEKINQKNMEEKAAMPDKVNLQSRSGC